MTSTPTGPAAYGELRAQLETLTTEAFRPELSEIDRLSTAEIAGIMNGEDASVPAAVAAQVAQGTRAANGMAAAAIGVVTLVVLRYADVTSSSMHPFYKRRLSSAFAVARKKDPDGKPVASEIPYETVLSLSNLRDGALHSLHRPTPPAPRGPRMRRTLRPPSASTRKCWGL